MMIVRSLGAASLVALMSAHRVAAEQRGTPGFDQETVAVIEAYLYTPTDGPSAGRYPATERLRSYN
jgi:hypothetical protein